MKAEQIKVEAFRPVILTLETQAEVDALGAILNHAWVCEAVGLVEETYVHLSPFMTEKYKALHNALTERMKSRAI